MWHNGNIAATFTAFELFKHISRRQWHARIDEHCRKLWQIDRTRQQLANSAHNARARIKADGDIGTDRACRQEEAWVVEGQTVGASNKSQGCRRVSRAAPEARRHGHILLKPKMPSFDTSDASANRCNRFANQIIDGRSRLAGKGAGNLESILRGSQRQRVRYIGEYDQAFELVIAVSAAADHPQCQIDLGGSLFDQRRAHAINLSFAPQLAAVAALLARFRLRRCLLGQP